MGKSGPASRKKNVTVWIPARLRSTGLAEKTCGKHQSPVTAAKHTSFRKPAHYADGLFFNNRVLENRAPQRARAQRKGTRFSSSLFPNSKEARASSPAHSFLAATADTRAAAQPRRLRRGPSVHPAGPTTSNKPSLAQRSCPPSARSHPILVGPHRSVVLASLSSFFYYVLLASRVYLSSRWCSKHDGRTPR